jgi:hypothetical protein
MFAYHMWLGRMEVVLIELVVALLIVALTLAAHPRPSLCEVASSYAHGGALSWPSLAWNHHPARHTTRTQ